MLRINFFVTCLTACSQKKRFPAQKVPENFENKSRLFVQASNDKQFLWISGIELLFNRQTELVTLFQTFCFCIKIKVFPQSER